jgi:hypothetical protein
MSPPSLLSHPTDVFKLRSSREVRPCMGDKDATVEEEQPLPGQVRRRGFLRPFLAFLDGEPTQTADLVAAGRILARIVVDQDRPVIVCGDGAWAGVWDLEQLTDTEAVTWGLWIAMKVRRLQTPS